MARSFEPGSDRDKRIRQACKEMGCTFTTLANDAVDIYLDILQEEVPAKSPQSTGEIPIGTVRKDSTANPEQISKGWVSEVRHDNGCIDRYEKDGKLKMHLYPDYVLNGVQRYRDQNKNIWYKDKNNQWIGIVQI